MTRDDLRDALQLPNVRAFLRVIRAGESSQNDAAYTVMFGGRHFEGFADHPKSPQTVGTLTSTAAGAYQFLSKTWAGLVAQYGFPDFSPQCQDEGCVALIAGRKALELVMEGRIHEAIYRCAKEWASLPADASGRGAYSGQSAISIEKALAVYDEYGGSLASAGAPAPQPAAPAQEVKKPMAPLLAFLPSILEAIPSLIKVFGKDSDSEVAKRNQAAGVLVAETLVKATGAVNLQDAVEKMEKDPAALQAARTAIDDLLPSIVEGGGGGVKAAREFAAAGMDGRAGRVIEVVTYWALALLTTANAIAFAAYWRSDKSDLLNTVIQADIGAALMAFGFWLGSTVSSQKKTDALIAK